MFSYIWPIGLVVLSNVLYSIATKSTPQNISPFCSMAITYFISAVVCVICFLIFGRGINFFQEVAKVNWSSFLLSVSIVGLEVGYIFVYRAGWQVSTASIVQSSILAVALLFLGFFLYKEPLNWSKLLGTGICLVGLYFINRR